VTLGDQETELANLVGELQNEVRDLKNISEKCTLDVQFLSDKQESSSEAYAELKKELEKTKVEIGKVSIET
jgi:archaellum component FlaC